MFYLLIDRALVAFLLFHGSTVLSIAKNIILGFRIMKKTKWPIMSVPNVMPTILKTKVIHIHGKTFKHQCKAWNEKSVSPSAPHFTVHSDLLLQRSAVKSFFCTPKSMQPAFRHMYKWFSKYYTNEKCYIEVYVPYFFA